MYDTNFTSTWIFHEPFGAIKFPSEIILQQLFKHAHYESEALVLYFQFIAPIKK